MRGAHWGDGGLCGAGVPPAIPQRCSAAVSAANLASIDRANAGQLPAPQCPPGGWVTRNLEPSKEDGLRNPHVPHQAGGGWDTLHTGWAAGWVHTLRTGWVGDNPEPETRPWTLQAQEREDASGAARNSSTTLSPSKASTAPINTDRMTRAPRRTTAPLATTASPMTAPASILAPGPT